jgi:hypothetical protein
VKHSIVWIPFDEPLTDTKQLRSVMITMARRAQRLAADAPKQQEQ